MSDNNIKKISMKEAAKMVKDAFGFKQSVGVSDHSFYSENGESTTFYIYKGDFDRMTVIDKIYDLFDGKVIDDGQCRISNITFVNTIVYIEPLGNDLRNDLNDDRTDKIDNRWKALREEYPDYELEDGSKQKITEMSYDTVHEIYVKMRDDRTKRDRWFPVFFNEINYRIKCKHQENKQLELF